MKTFLDVFILMPLWGYYEDMRRVPDEAGNCGLHAVKSPFYKGRLRGILYRGTPPRPPFKKGVSKFIIVLTNEN